MKRKIYSELLEWKTNRSTKEALLIEGARRVGKSYIVEACARREYDSYILVDFSTLSSEQLDLFDNYLNKKDLDVFFRLISLEWGVKLKERHSLIIFDEVQKYPKARQAIKMLVADHRYDYIETGSLVSIRKNTKGVLIPSEERKIPMSPMDFEEFLWAVGEDQLMDYTRECFAKQEHLQPALHRKMMLLLRTYMIVGGMPQAVQTWVETQDFEQVDKAKRLLLDLYRNDIYNYAGIYAEKTIRIWDSIPAQLQRHEKRFRIGFLKQGARTRNYQNALFWLKEARIVNFCVAATEPNVGLSMNKDDSRYKLYLNDTGLLISHSFSDNLQNLNELYKKLMLGKLEINKGMLVENLVAQMLEATGRKLFFFAHHDANHKDDTMEIDFLIRKTKVTSRKNISPIEVKSTQRYTLGSLKKFQLKYAEYCATTYVLHAAEYKQLDGITYLPLYMTVCL
ncbi:MAG: AAA family ATPase [Bacteroidales bacterium]|nr:AAA family ATPase [Bacteroidales bacterium]